jgi:hypothetical protein
LEAAPATGPDGVSHWGDAQVLASLAGAVALLVLFVLIEMRTSRPLLPMRILRDVAAGIGLLALLIGIATIRVSRKELAGAAPEPQEAASQPAASQPAAPQPGTVLQHEDRATLAVAAAARPCRLC